jgi:hypothetical protein
MKSVLGLSPKYYLTYFAALALILSFSGLWSTPRVQAASDIYVSPSGSDSNSGTSIDDAKLTIAAGVAAVDAGGTVHVAAGTYNGPVTINKSLTLEGEGPNTILDGVTKTGNGITFAAGATNVTISKLKIINFSVGVFSQNIALDGIVIEEVESSQNASAGFAFAGSVPIQNIRFSNVIANDNNLSGLGRGIMMQSMSKTNITVENSTFLRNRIAGIDLNDGPNSGLAARNVRISGNTVSGGTGVGEATDSGIALLAYDPDGIGEYLVSNNTITVYGRYGIEIKNAKGNGASSGPGSVVVTGNRVSKGGGPFTATGTNELRDIAGIAVIERTADADNGVHLPTTGVMVTNNTVTGFKQNNPGSQSTGFGIVVGGLNHRVLNNNVSENDVGIQLQQGHNQVQADQNDEFFGRDYSQNTSAVVNYNQLVDNTLGLRSLNVAANNATLTCNWWNDQSGPSSSDNPGGLGQSLSGLGQFAPWMIHGEDADPSSPGWQHPTSIQVTAGADTSAADNNYRRLANAVGCALSDQEFILSGTFDWTQPYADADWALGNDKVSGSDDDYTIKAPANVNNVTIRANALGDATIQGPGDKDSVNFEGVFYFYDVGVNQGWTFSNLKILDFDFSIGFFCCLGGTPAGTFNNTTIDGNHIRVARDVHSSVAPADASQNIGIHYARGNNITISNNLIELYGDGEGDGEGEGSVAMQSNTHGGANYDGLQIIGNTVRVLETQSNSPERVIGIWENGHAHSSNITIKGNTFENLAADNDPLLNNQTAFRLTSQSSANSQVLVEQNTVNGAQIGMAWLSAGSANQPIVLRNNTLTAVNHGFRLENNARAKFEGNQVSAVSGSTGYGIEIPSTAQASLEASPNQNSFSGLGTAALVNGTLTIGAGTSFSGGVDGLVVEGASASVSLGAAEFSGQTNNYITLITHPTDLDGRSALFEGVTGAEMNEAQYTNVQNKIVDKNDTNALGLVILADTSLQVAPLNLDFQTYVGANPPASQSFSIGNAIAGQGSLDWEISAPDYGTGATGWLSCTPTSATGVALGDSTLVSCSVDASALQAGSYSATLSVSSSTPNVQGTPQTVSVSLQVDPINISLSPASSTVELGAQGSLLLTLNAALANATTVTLSSSNSQIASVPANVTIPAGSLSVSIPVNGLAAGGPVTIQASLLNELGGASSTAQVSVSSVGISLQSSSPTLLVGSQGTLTITISKPQASPTAISLSSSLPNVVSLVNSVTIPANNTSVTVALSANAVGGPATILASLPNELGGGSASVEVSVISLKVSLTPAQNSIRVGQQALLQVSLDTSLSQNLTLTLSSSDPTIAEVAPSLTIPAGQTSAQVIVTGKKAGGPVTIELHLPESMADENGSTLAASATVTVQDIEPEETVYQLYLPLVVKADE